MITQRSAGTVSVTGGLVSPGGLSAAPKGDGSYDGVTAPGNLWAGGETLTIAASGAEVPSFSHGVTAPSRTVNIVSPVLPPPSSLPVPRNTDFVVSWDTGTVSDAGQLTVNISALDRVTLSCSFDVSKKTGAIPTAALSRLSDGDGTMTIGVSTTTEAVKNGYLVYFFLSTSANAAGAEVGFTPLILQ